MNKKPDSIKIGWKDVQIEYVNPGFFKNNTDYWGQYLARKSVIEIQEEIQGDDLANTLIHEVLHAIVYTSSLNAEGGALEDAKDEEQTVNSIANHLMSVIKDNPWFLDFLKEQIKPENQKATQKKLL